MATRSVTARRQLQPLPSTPRNVPFSVIIATARCAPTAISPHPYLHPNSDGSGQSARFRRASDAVDGDGAHWTIASDDDHWEQPGNLFRLMSPPSSRLSLRTLPARWAMRTSTLRSGTSPIACAPIRPTAPASPRSRHREQTRCGLSRQRSWTGYWLFLHVLSLVGVGCAHSAARLLSMRERGRRWRRRPDRRAGNWRRALLNVEVRIAHRAGSVLKRACCWETSSGEKIPRLLPWSSSMRCPSAPVSVHRHRKLGESG